MTSWLVAHSNKQNITGEEAGGWLLPAHFRGWGSDEAGTWPPRLNAVTSDKSLVLYRHYAKNPDCFSVPLPHDDAKVIKKQEGAFPFALLLFIS